MSINLSVYLVAKKFLKVNILIVSLISSDRAELFVFLHFNIDLLLSTLK